MYVKYRSILYSSLQMSYESNPNNIPIQVKALLMSSAFFIRYC